MWDLAYLTVIAGRFPEAEALWAEGIKQCQLDHGAEKEQLRHRRLAGTPLHARLLFATQGGFQPRRSGPVPLRGPHRLNVAV